MKETSVLYFKTSKSYNYDLLIYHSRRNNEVGDILKKGNGNKQNTSITPNSSFSWQQT
jgi:hypothetical protein